jgi:DUF1009 family protein
MDNKARPKRAVVMSLLDEGDGRSRLLMDDVRSKGESIWAFDAFFTQRIFENGCLDSMTLTDEDHRDIGMAVARLRAVSGHTNKL